MNEEHSERFGALDVGSNSVRMLVVERQDGSLRYVESSAEITRMTQGWGTDAKGDVLPQALERTAQEVRKVRQRLDFWKIPEVNRVCFATESLRGARNASGLWTFWPVLRDSRCGFFQVMPRGAMDFMGPAWHFPKLGGSLIWAEGVWKCVRRRRRCPFLWALCA